MIKWVCVYCGRSIAQVTDDMLAHPETHPELCDYPVNKGELHDFQPVVVEAKS